MTIKKCYSPKAGDDRKNTPWSTDRNWVIKAFLKELMYSEK